MIILFKRQNKNLHYSYGFFLNIDEVEDQLQLHLHEIQKISII